MVELRFEQMSPELRALIAYAPNDSFDIEDSQAVLDRVVRETPVVRWEMGVAFFTMDDIVAARNPAVVSTNPATGIPYGMGSRGRSSRSISTASATATRASCSTHCSRPRWSRRLRRR